MITNCSSNVFKLNGVNDAIGSMFGGAYGDARMPNWTH